MNQDFLSNYGDWNVERFIQCHQEIDTTLMLIDVANAKADRTGGEEIGSLIVSVWHTILECLVNAYGHRLGWNKLAFIVPKPSNLVLTETVISAVQPFCSSDYTIRAAGLSFARHNRLIALHDFEWKFALANYRGGPSFAWYIYNGMMKCQ